MTVCVAMQAQNQIVETEHLFKALLEQPNGLARRILSKAGSNATDMLDKTDAYIRSQPRVSGDAAQVLPCNLVLHCSVMGLPPNLVWRGCPAPMDAPSQAVASHRC